MRKLHFTKCASLIIVAAGLWSGAAQAQNPLDFFTPPSGEGIVPMETILDSARATMPGQVMEIELERKRRGWVYEVEILPQNGEHKMKLTFDAQSGALLSKEKD